MLLGVFILLTTCNHNLEPMLLVTPETILWHQMHLPTFNIFTHSPHGLLVRSRSMTALTKPMLRPYRDHDPCSLGHEHGTTAPLKADPGLTVTLLSLLDFACSSDPSELPSVNYFSLVHQLGGDILLISPKLASTTVAFHLPPTSRLPWMQIVTMLSPHLRPQLCCLVQSIMQPACASD
jgi:hypothetical protein